MAKLPGGGFGTTLVWDLVLVILVLVAAIGLARYGNRIPIIARIYYKGRKMRGCQLLLSSCGR